jgi:hypothetical protein
MEATERRQKRCVYCGRYYRPDPRVRKTQKSCSNAKCRAKRKRESQRRWVEANPDYFKGRYVNVKEWRRNHPDYQRLWRRKAREIQDEISPAEPVRTMVLVIPEKMLKDKIQDEIRLVRQCRCGLYVAGGGKAAARYKIRLTHAPGCTTLEPCAGRGATP